MARGHESESQSNSMDQRPTLPRWSRLLRGIWRALNAPIFVALLSAAAGSLATLVVQAKISEPARSPQVVTVTETETIATPPGGASSAGSTSPPLDAKPVNASVFLNEQKALVGALKGGSYTVNTQRYDHSLAAINCWEQKNEYLLNRRFHRLQAVVGLSDETDFDTKVTFTVVGDGRELFAQELTFGKSVPVDVNVTDVLRLQIGVSTDSCVDGAAVWGDPRLY
jgi:hypothetical protein